jgi:hypothetical protein
VLQLTDLRDGDSDMMDEVPARVTRLFGNERARPKILRVYSADTGWAAAKGTPELTWDAIDELVRLGATSVEAKWRFRTKQFSILDMHRPRPDGSVELKEPGVRQPRRARGIQN